MPPTTVRRRNWWERLRGGQRFLIVVLGCALSILFVIWILPDSEAFYRRVESIPSVKSEDFRERVLVQANHYIPLAYRWFYQLRRLLRGQSMSHEESEKVLFIKQMMKQEWRHYLKHSKALTFDTNVKKQNLGVDNKKSPIADDAAHPNLKPAADKKAPLAADADHPNLQPRRPLAVVPNPQKEHLAPIIPGAPKPLEDAQHEKPLPNPNQNPKQDPLPNKEAGLAPRPTDKDPFTYRMSDSGASGLSDDRSLADVLDALDGLLVAGLVDEALEARQLIERQLLPSRIGESYLNTATDTLIGGLLSAFTLTHDELYLSRALDFGELVYSGMQPSEGQQSIFPHNRIILDTDAMPGTYPLGLIATVNLGTLAVTYSPLAYLSELSGDYKFVIQAEAILYELLTLNRPKNAPFYPAYVSWQKGEFAPEPPASELEADAFRATEKKRARIRYNVQVKPTQTRPLLPPHPTHHLYTYGPETAAFYETLFNEWHRVAPLHELAELGLLNATAAFWRDPSGARRASNSNPKTQKRVLRKTPDEIRSDRPKRATPTDKKAMRATADADDEDGGGAAHERPSHEARVDFEKAFGASLEALLGALVRYASADGAAYIGELWVPSSLQSDTASAAPAFQRRMHHRTCGLAGLLAASSLQTTDRTKSVKYLQLAQKLAESCHKRCNSTATRLCPAFQYYEGSSFDDVVSALDSEDALEGIPRPKRGAKAGAGGAAAAAAAAGHGEHPDYEAEDEEAARARERNYDLWPDMAATYLHLWRTTHDHKYREWGWQLALAIEAHCGTERGYQGVRDVYRNASGHLAHRPAPTFEKVPRTGNLIGATLKYLLLLFSADELLAREQYVLGAGSWEHAHLQAVPGSIAWCRTVDAVRLIGGRHRHSAGRGGSGARRQQQLEEDVQTDVEKRMERLVSFSPSTRELADALCPLERTRALGLITYRLWIDVLLAIGGFLIGFQCFCCCLMCLGMMLMNLLFWINPKLIERMRLKSSPLQQQLIAQHHRDGKQA